MRFFCFHRIPAWCIVKVGQLIGTSFEIQGLENINRKCGGIVLINHQSAIDLIGNTNICTNLLTEMFYLLVVLAKLWPVIGRATQVAKKEVLLWFPFGLACWLWGTLFIDRQNKSSAQDTINKESKAINEKKVKINCGIEQIISLLRFHFQSKILFFPEGTRNQSGRFH